MTKISAQIVADSICNGHRITTMLATFPRFILAEFNTHRMFSRNSASSRAIPFKKMVESVKNDPFIPIAWQRDHPGMQGTEYWTDEVFGEKSTMKVADSFIGLWLEQRDNALIQASMMNRHGATKQLCNRLLEPFMWHTVLVTATEWENFFHLRCPQYSWSDKKVKYRSRRDFLMSEDANMCSGKDDFKNWTDLQWLGINDGQAEIHMMALAEAMWDARNESKPKELQPGEWHIPFGDNINSTAFKELVGVSATEESRSTLYENTTVKIATARAARTSYTVVGEEGKPADYKKDIELHDKLLASGHMSPFEHCAQAMTEEELYNYPKGLLDWEQVDKTTSDKLGWSHNFHGWKSYRSMIPNENRR